MGKKSSNHGKHGDSFFDSSFDRTIASFLEFMFFEHYVAQEEEKEDADEWRFTLTDEFEVEIREKGPSLSSLHFSSQRRIIQDSFLTTPQYDFTEVPT